MSNKREKGYYHVKIDERWVIAEWDGDDWWLCGITSQFADHEFQEINEQKITRNQDSKITSNPQP